jgi:hypothetical protein
MSEPQLGAAVRWGAEPADLLCLCAAVTVLMLTAMLQLDISFAEVEAHTS